MPFDNQFRPEHLDIARWLCTEVERQQASAGAAAMAALAPRLEL
jgi:hypothetical protein